MGRYTFVNLVLNLIRLPIYKNSMVLRQHISSDDQKLMQLFLSLPTTLLPDEPDFTSQPVTARPPVGSNAAANRLTDCDCTPAAAPS